MQKTIISLVILGVVLVGSYFIIKNGKDVNTTPVVSNEINTNEETPAPEGKKIAFSEFVKQGGTYKCDTKQTMSDFENNGTIYINGTDMRGDFTTVAEGKTIKASMILKDGYSYNWSSASNMGFKMKTVKDSATDESDLYAWNADQIGDYNCEPWTVDESIFTPPTNITFKTTGV